MISDLTLNEMPAPGSRPKFTFAIPADQAVAHARTVPMAAMEEVRALLNAMAEIHSAKKVLPACKRLAASMQRAGWSADRLRTRYYEFVRGTDQYSAGDWRILLNKSKARVDNAAAVATRFAFHEFWRKLGENNHQDWAAAHDELLKIWRAGYDNTGRQHTAIPGYAKWPEADPFYGHPEGWSYANLMRQQSNPYDQVAARLGHRNASMHRLPVLTDRTPLQVGQYIEFDDHEFNQKVLFQRKPMRPLGFGAVDVFSDCPLSPGFKPTLWDFEEEAKRKLTEREFLWYVVAILTTVGYRADIGTEFIVERGTAAIRPEFEKRIFEVTNKMVTVFRGGRFGRPSHDGQFKGAPKGNFKTKALIEGFWRMVDDQTASLPGQVGRNRDDSPEELHGAEQYTASIMRQVETGAAAKTLTQEQLEQLKFPFPMFSTWREWALDAFHRIATDRTHNLQGWEKLGFVQPIWRLPVVSAGAASWLPWSEFLKLPGEQQAVVKSMIDSDRSLVRDFRLNRKEVFDAGCKQMTRIPWELLPSLVGPENALSDPLTVDKGLFRFDCAEIDSDTIEFYARDGKNFLPNGEKYLCFVNPYAPTHLVACTACGPSLKVVAVCPRYIRATRNDAQSVERLLGDQQSFEAQARVRLNLRHSDDAAAKREMLENNSRVLAEAQPGAIVPRGSIPSTTEDCTADLLARENAAPADEESWQ